LQKQQKKTFPTKMPSISGREKIRYWMCVGVIGISREQIISDNEIVL
jgi:hypothetical protein